MKKVMLIGDSIRMGYQAGVTQLLSNLASVQGPDENCRFSAYTLFHLATWMSDDDYDVVHWNNGLWDTSRMPDGKIHTPLAMYLEFHDRIASILLKKTKRLIFATTTPVWPEQFTSGSIRPRDNADIRAYNHAAAELHRKNGIAINDLHTLISADIKHFVSEDMIHLTPAGNEVCANRVASCIADNLGDNLGT